MATETQFMIRSVNESDLFWSNDDGWVDVTQAHTFTAKEKAELNLPMEGQWVDAPAPAAPANEFGWASMYDAAFDEGRVVEVYKPTPPAKPDPTGWSMMYDAAFDGMPLPPEPPAEEIRKLVETAARICEGRGEPLDEGIRTRLAESDLDTVRKAVRRLGSDPEYRMDEFNPCRGFGPR